MKKLLLVLVAFMVAECMLAQKLVADGSVFKFSSGDKEMRIEFCTPSMFRVRVSWNKTFEAPEPWMVVKYNWAKLAVKTSDDKGIIQLQTSLLTLKISKATLKLDVLDKQGQLLSSEDVDAGGTAKSRCGAMHKATVCR